MIKFEKVSKKFNNGTTALSEVDFEIKEKEFVFLTGPSGAGKSTIIRLLIGDYLPTSGSVKFLDWEVNKIPPKKLPHMRRKMGIVFQELKLLMDRSVFENVAIALEVLGAKDKEIKEKVKETLEMVGLGDDMEKYPLQLSGGELQRTAIARAIIKKPDILLADEPTADLDPATSWEIIRLLNEINKMGTTVIMATHNLEIVNALGKRVMSLDKGKIIKDEEKGKYNTG